MKDKLNSMKKSIEERIELLNKRIEENQIKHDCRPEEVASIYMGEINRARGEKSGLLSVFKELDEILQTPAPSGQVKLNVSNPEILHDLFERMETMFYLSSSKCRMIKVTGQGINEENVAFEIAQDVVFEHIQILKKNAQNMEVFARALRSVLFEEEKQ